MSTVLRITQIPNRDTVTLKLEGKLLHPWVPELRSASLAASSAGRPLRLDLQQLSFADDLGAQTLRELISHGAKIAACSDFISELLNREQHS